MRIFLTLFSFFILLGGMKGANWPNTPPGATSIGSYNSTPVTANIPNVANNNYIAITIDPGETWIVTLSSGEMSIFSGPGLPTGGTMPLSTTTSGSVTLTSTSPGSGTFYILFTFTGPPNRTVTVNGTSTPLPVTWLSVRAEQKNTGIIISWATAQEVNNDFFTVERSSNGINWEEIGTEVGSGNSTVERQYQFQDKDPSNRMNYYRIRQTDFDGKFSYSKVVSAIFDVSSYDVKILAQNSNITVTSSEAIDITIFDASGRQYINKKINFYDEIFVPNGQIYFVKINGTTAKKIVVP